jgi:delta-aminolevulinic acid dehydratase/porphobilinogen synthase
MSFPEHRPRRLRRTLALRALVRETRLHAEDLIVPMFCKEGIDEPAAISSMPGQYQHTLESLRKEAVATAETGVRAFYEVNLEAATRTEEFSLAGGITESTYTQHLDSPAPQSSNDPRTSSGGLTGPPPA